MTDEPNLQSSTVPYGPGDSTLAGLCQLWIEKIKKAREYKKKVFQDDADEGMRFYRPPDGTYDWVYSSDDRGSRWAASDVTDPPIRMTLNKVAELVEIFGPILYAKNPIRQVNPRQPAQIPPTAIPDPFLYQYLMMQEAQRSQHDSLKSMLISTYLNWTPTALNLKEHVKRGIEEALIKGRGLLWCGTWTPPGSDTTYVGSFFDTVDFFFVDPDSESLENAWWIARQVCQPVWQAERRFGLKKGSLKANHESVNAQVETDYARKDFDRARGLTNDLVTYYEIYSRMGCGGRLSGSHARRTDDLLPGDLSAFAAVLDPLVGDHCFLVVADGVPYPLNVPPDIQDIPVTGAGDEQDGGPVLKERMSWPVPFWEDGTWPCTCLDFHNVPRQAWPMSHIKPALGELRFLCWAYSFVACKIKNTLRDVVAVLKEMADNFKLQILEGADLSMVELDTNNRDIRECVQILQFPQMNADIWKIIQAVEANFEKRVGLDEAKGHGVRDTQPRSATESQAQQQAANIRPDDMADCVEEWMTKAARKEALAARLLLAPKDVLPMLGLTSAALWATYVSTRDMGVMRELEYRIEAGSTRKPNRDRDQQNADSGFQVLGPILQGFAASQGQVGPLNALIGLWCKTRDIPPGPFMIQPPMPMMPPPGGPPPGGGGPPPGGGSAAHNGAPAHAGAAR